MQARVCASVHCVLTYHMDMLPDLGPSCPQHGLQSPSSEQGVRRWPGLQALFRVCAALQVGGGELPLRGGWCRTCWVLISDSQLWNSG